METKSNGEGGTNAPLYACRAGKCCDEISWQQRPPPLTGKKGNIRLSAPLIHNDWLDAEKGSPLYCIFYFPNLQEHCATISTFIRGASTPIRKLYCTLDQEELKSSFGEPTRNKEGCQIIWQQIPITIISPYLFHFNCMVMAKTHIRGSSSKFKNQHKLLSQ